MNTTIIETQNLNFSYEQQPVIRDVNLRIKSGDFMAMIGPNGGGKTTLIKLMLGLLNADSGSIRIFGKTPQDVSHRIGYGTAFYTLVIFSPAAIPHNINAGFAFYLQSFRQFPPVKPDWV